VFAHEELLETDAVGFNPGQSDQEGVGAGSTRKARRLGVQEDHPLKVHLLEVSPQARKPAGRQGQSLVQADHSVVMVSRELTSAEQEPPPIAVHFLPTQEILQGARRESRVRGSQTTAVIQLSQPLAQIHVGLPSQRRFGIPWQENEAGSPPLRRGPGLRRPTAF